MQSIIFITNLLTFYIKGCIATEQNFLKIKYPNTLMRIIPCGSQVYNIPVEQISTVATNFRFSIKDFFGGLIFLNISIACFNTGGYAILWGLFFLVNSIVTILNSFITELIIHSTASVNYRIPFIIFEKGKSAIAEQMITEIINSRLKDTNNKEISEADKRANKENTQAIIDAIKSK